MSKLSTKSSDSELVRKYLRDLDHELRFIPRRQRREFVSSIANHISEGHSEEGQDIRNVLNALGTPSDIATEYVASFDDTNLRNLDRATPWLLTIGGLAGLIGWGIGIYGVWTSRVWRLADKILGSLLFPALVADFFLAIAGSDRRSCSTEPHLHSCQSQSLVVLQVAILVLVLAEFFRLLWLMYSRQQS